MIDPNHSETPNSSELDRLREAIKEVAISKAIEWGRWSEAGNDTQVCTVQIKDVSVGVTRDRHCQYVAAVLP